MSGGVVIGIVSLLATFASVPTSRQEQVEILNRTLREFDEAARIGASDPDAARRGYEAARRDFEALIAGGVRNGRLHYNLANTCVRLGRIGPAILHYRRAERLIPGDSRLAENLRFARTLRQDQIDTPATGAVLRSLLFWHYGTSLPSRLGAGLIAYAVFWMLLGVRLFVRTRPAALAWSIRLAAVVTLALSASVLADLYLRTTVEGVITANGVILRKGNGETYEPRFDHQFAEGVEFVLVEPPRGDWLHIQLPDGKDGWIRRDQASLL